MKSFNNKLRRKLRQNPEMRNNLRQIKQDCFDAGLSPSEKLEYQKDELRGYRFPSLSCFLENSGDVLIPIVTVAGVFSLHRYIPRFNSDASQITAGITFCLAYLGILGDSCSLMKKIGKSQQHYERASIDLVRKRAELNRIVKYSKSCQLPSDEVYHIRKSLEEI